MAKIKAFDFTVKINNLQEACFVEKSFDERLEPNQVLLAIDQFAFTSNNITYGVVGEKMNYWQFFPSTTGDGIIPAWGFATVILSAHPAIKTGDRYYGYYPTGSHLLVTAAKASNQGFFDATTHRRSLPSIYNYYTNCAFDAGYTADNEWIISLFRPLFITSFLIDEHLAENKFYGAAYLVITSASSKTAQALACLVANRQKEHHSSLQIVGLTSEKNREYVRELGWYDQTLHYANLDQLPDDRPVVIVDFTGNHQTQFNLQTKLKDKLVYNCLVGLVDWQHLKGEETLPNKGDFFFAPTHAAKRQHDWGGDGYLRKVGGAWNHFTDAISSRDRKSVV